MDWIQTIDHQVLSAIAQHVRTDWLTACMTFVSTICNHGEIWIALALLCLLHPKTRRCGAAILTALALGAFLGNVCLKPFFERPRPFLTYADLTPIITPGGFSFPSGHTTASFTAATACFAYFRRSGALCYVLAAAIGFSRLYLGVHYPSDVLGGIALGIACGALAAWLVNQSADRIHFARLRK